MRDYIIRRFFLIIPTLLIVTVILFGMVRFVPGSALELMVAEMEETAEVTEVTIEHVRQELGLDVPVHVQYARWFGDILRGDLGNSLWTGRSISEELIEKLPVSLELGIIAVVIGLIIALPIGVYSAIRQDTGADYIGRTAAIIGLSLPNFWLATMLMVYPAIWWGWSPPVKYIPFTTDPLGNAFQFLWPGLIMGTAHAAGTMRMTRTMMLEVLRQDYIRTAWAKGLRERAVVMRHAMKNAMIPVVTMIGMQIPGILNGAVIMETIFALPGVGYYIVEGVRTRDYTVIQGVNLFLAAALMVVNLVTDLTYAWLDPRIRYK